MVEATDHQQQSWRQGIRVCMDITGMQLMTPTRIPVLVRPMGTTTTTDGMLTTVRDQHMPRSTRSMKRMLIKGNIGITHLVQYSFPPLVAHHRSSQELPPQICMPRTKLPSRRGDARREESPAQRQRVRLSGARNHSRRLTRPPSPMTIMI
mmetsp:Transcript_33972/g.79451  ORF Transcript_33972/g.79451 Transcript_33972/m.79451 type:complete len:151 (+) Transcript_33972:541-993(+)